MSRIEQIRQRLAAATPGPWEMGVKRNAGRTQVYPAGGSRALCAPPPVGGGMYKPSEQHELIDQWPANAALIANAPADLAYLLGLVDELKSQLRRDRDK